MSEQPPKPRRRRQGKSLGWDAKAIEQAAHVGPEDADAVAAWWDKHAPNPARTLLEAQEEEPET